ncbi:hypothetical protein RBU61_08275 [Tissierella sp. MB52-C2]|uniref:hypothetical protein n=1 Tax=Tissierella sp. MB52-C2 TaxID=3070999 RepID=UPI00280A69A3|nr:hypothetical protein [Tissierella sp. MB52-C2]WMM26660.1 hypothetical protein RBU61_08275 [Tissierella sp. MB52-C2]
MSKLANMRKGILEHKIVNYPGTNERVGIVSLNNKDIIGARENAMRYATEHPVDMDTADLILSMFTLKEAMRNPENLGEYFVCDFEEINEFMNPKEVYELHNVFVEVQNGKTSDLEDLTLEEFEDIKKKLEKMELKELNGELQTILKYFLLQMNLKTLQRDN